MKKPLLTLGITICTLLTPLTAKAANFISEITGIYAFGDSLTDTGNLLSATGGALPPFPYLNGRFSNGPNWVDYLAQSLNLSSPTPFFSGLPPTDGVNFAIGGATTGLANTLNIPALPGLQQQIAAFVTPLKLSHQLVDPKGLYLIWGGGNDYLPTNSLTFTPLEIPDQTVQNLAAAITALASVGAKNIVTVNVPDLGTLPRTLGNDPSFPLSADDPTPLALNALSQAHNTQLSNTLKSLRKSLDPSVNLISYDLNSLLNDVIANPAAFGFTNVTETCIFTPSCVFDPIQQQQYLFWDGIHPTTRGFQLIANRALDTLSQQASVPEPGMVIGIFAFGFFAMGARKFKAKKS